MDETGSHQRIFLSLFDPMDVMVHQALEKQKTIGLLQVFEGRISSE